MARNDSMNRNSERPEYELAEIAALDKLFASREAKPPVPHDVVPMEVDHDDPIDVEMGIEDVATPAERSNKAKTGVDHALDCPPLAEDHGPWVHPNRWADLEDVVMDPLPRRLIFSDRIQEDVNPCSKDVQYVSSPICPRQEGRNCCIESES